ncbi:MAG: PilZ domain-containing protein [Acidobacteriia bacterium]|nr:PilZ domain-containing protein [Terriglobia bacterium]
MGNIHNEIVGTILNISHGAIHVKVPEFLPAKPVRVWFSEDCHNDGQVIFCRAEKDAYRTGIHFPPDPRHHKRSELRIPLTNQPAVISHLEGGTGMRYDAQAIDISRSGLGLLVERHFTVDTWVKVELGFAIAFGEVMYSKPTESGVYRVGLRVETLLMREGAQGQSFEMAEWPSFSELRSETTGRA